MFKIPRHLIFKMTRYDGTALVGLLDDGVIVLAGRAAAAVEGGAASGVVEWKSDIAPVPQDICAHEIQLRHYMTVIDVQRAALVL
jgi:hypothetical protein